MDNKKQNNKEAPSKTLVCIDGSNIFFTQKKLGWTIDWAKFYKFISDKFPNSKINFYLVIKPGDEKNSKFAKFLERTGYSLTVKTLKKIIIKEGGKKKIKYKGDLDVEITTDAILAALSKESGIENFVLISGDSDFDYLIQTLRHQKIPTQIISSRRTISWEIKLSAKKIVYVEDIKKQIMRGSWLTKNKKDGKL